MGGNPERAEMAILTSQAWRNWPKPTTIRTNDATALGGKRDGVTSGTTTMGATFTAVVGTEDNATAADADDGTAAANAARGAARYVAGPTINEHDDATTAVRQAKSIQANFLTGRDGF